MKGLWNIEVHVTGLRAEKLLNLLRSRGIPVSAIRRAKDRSLFFACQAADYPRIRELIGENGWEIAGERPGRLLEQWRKRGRIMVSGLGLFLAAVIFSLQFIWAVEIENAGAYEGEVRYFLEERGIRPGIFKQKVNLSALREQLEWRLPKVKWVRAGLEGVSLRIRLEEGTPPPEIADAGGTGDVIAGEAGLLMRLTTFAGTPAAKAGQVVKAGQVLIKGEERRKDGTVEPVKAQGAAIAKVWRSVKIHVPEEETVTLPTGKRCTRRIIETPLFAWCAEKEPSYLTADQEVRSLPIGGAWFPVSLRKEVWEEAALEKNPRNAEEVKQEGAKAALQALNLAFPDQMAVDKWINFSMIEGGTIEVTATGEWQIDIARFRKN